MTFVKICGITNREDAHVAIEAGADALGFIGVQESPRFVGAAAFRRIREVLPDDFPLVVVVRRPGDGARYETPIIQYYEEGAIDDGLKADTKRIKVFRVRDADDIDSAMSPADGIHAVLLDAFHAALLGGSGSRFNWSLADALHDGAQKPFILAGGLTPHNVSRALTELRPYAVDVSSGVEDITPGNKDHELVRRFVAAVRDWDYRNGITPHKPGSFLRGSDGAPGGDEGPGGAPVPRNGAPADGGGDSAKRLEDSDEPPRGSA